MPWSHLITGVKHLNNIGCWPGIYQIFYGSALIDSWLSVMLLSHFSFISLAKFLLKNLCLRIHFWPQIFFQGVNTLAVSYLLAGPDMSRHFNFLGEPIQVALVESWFDEHNGFLAAHCLKDIHFPTCSPWVRLCNRLLYLVQASVSKTTFRVTWRKKKGRTDRTEAACITTCEGMHIFWVFKAFKQLQAFARQHQCTWQLHPLHLVSCLQMWWSWSSKRKSNAVM